MGGFGGFGGGFGGPGGPGPGGWPHASKIRQEGHITSFKGHITSFKNIVLHFKSNFQNTAVARKVVGKKQKVHATRPKGSMDKSIELLHALNNNEI